MNKYEIRTQKKKTAIVTTALELFKKKGFVGVSIKEIASLAQVSQVSIYNYFGNKEGLVKECANLMMEDTLTQAKNLLTKNMDFKEKLFTALALCTNNMSQYFYDYFSQEALNDKILSNLLFESLNKQKTDIYRSYIELGKQEGVVNASISTSTILDFLEAINIACAKVDSSEIMKTKELEIQKLLLYGLLGKE